jgi:hypothetical protein
MATILSSRPVSRRPVPGSTRLARWLDELAPLLLLAAVLAVVAVAARDAHAAGPQPVIAHAAAE